MTRLLRFRPEAETELLAAIDWYEKQGTGLGAELARSIEAAIANIERTPLAYPAVHGAVRRAPTRRFPYSILYVVTDEQVTVIACFHARRDPRVWQSRGQ